MATLLVVDDVPDNLAVLNELLRGHHKVKVANTGIRAIEIATKTQPDLILLDVVMPEMDGHEVCRRLKADPATAAIPIIFLSARAEETDEQAGFALGAVDYIAKPFSPPITLARIKAHLGLKEARDALEQRNREDQRRFEIALAQQIELNALKSSFVSMASHEFRTPLTAILSSQDLLRHYGERLSAQERDKTLATIENAVQRMLGMLDQVLTVGRAEAKGLEFRPRPLALAPLCASLRTEALAAHRPRLMRPDAPQPIVTLDNQVGDITVLADESLLRHMLGNLLSNAIKYSPDGALVRFTVAHAGDAIEFHVADTGIGIPAEDLPRLFGDFHRASNVGGIAGTGLGLAIVKRAAATHGGTVSVASTAGEGTCFTVRIPGTDCPREPDGAGTP